MSEELPLKLMVRVILEAWLEQERANKKLASFWKHYYAPTADSRSFSNIFSDVHTFPEAMEPMEEETIFHYGWTQDRENLRGNYFWAQDRENIRGYFKEAMNTFESEHGVHQ